MRVETRKCGHETMVYSRVVGFYTEVAGWNLGKTEEFKERVPYSVEKAIEKNQENASKRT